MNGNVVYWNNPSFSTSIHFCLLTSSLFCLVLFLILDSSCLVFTFVWKVELKMSLIISIPWSECEIREPWRSSPLFSPFPSPSAQCALSSFLRKQLHLFFFFNETKAYRPELSWVIETVTSVWPPADKSLLSCELEESFMSD